MRWDELFADLEVAAEGLAQQERDAEIAERTRTELAGLTLLDRLRAGVGKRLALRVRGLGRVEGWLRRVTPVWLLLDVDGRNGWAVAIAAVTAIDGLSPAAASSGQVAAVSARTTWSTAFRALSRDRDLVAVHLVEGGSVRGIPARVGRDFVELWLRDEDLDSQQPPRWTVVPYEAVAGVALRTTGE